jgi:amino-acid N-acetyltransferase
MRSRKAMLPDSETVHNLICAYSPDGTLLPRTFAEICENIRDFTVVEERGKIIACGALHLYGPHLSEIRSITVSRRVQGKGAGRLLVEALMREAEDHRVTCVCLFTRIPEFFSKMGFSVARREELPDKIYKDCVNCPRINACDEIAMVRGELPGFAILQQPESILVKIEA